MTLALEGSKGGLKALMFFATIFKKIFVSYPATRGLSVWMRQNHNNIGTISNVSYNPLPLTLPSSKGKKICQPKYATFFQIKIYSENSLIEGLPVIHRITSVNIFLSEKPFHGIHLHIGHVIWPCCSRDLRWIKTNGYEPACQPKQPGCCK